ncbi:hypothetical protein [Myxococcus virescens]|uniref:Uncharacterized protein n=1 Tax=Myxococcus virescens TaxID=83456 RepID=A0A511HPJ7_9BACT|nr:hypothetical protein [Myxococcus virescens]GEL75513.1 hypothetical protein MVI01_72970 [Myxococcus virescens]SDD65786.1 hypothetical protein SAMN04488504_102156 [Myxococcus virescens]
MLRHTLTHALEDLRHRVSAGSPSLTVAMRYVRLSDRARVELDKLLDATRFEVEREQFASPFAGRESRVSTRALVNWVEARKAVSHCEGPRSAGGLGLKGWEDVGGLTRLETVGLLTLAMERLERTPEVGAGPLFPGLQASRP